MTRLDPVLALPDALACVEGLAAELGLARTRAQLAEYRGMQVGAGA